MIARIRGLWALLGRELAKFGVVGVLNFIIDMGLFNVLVAGPLSHKVTTAKFISGGVATVFAWLGNRYWTFRDRRNRPVHHEVVLFFVVNGIALLITTAWVAFAHYVLHAESRAWLNFNAFIGIGLGTIFRFWTYHRFVFAKEPAIGIDGDGDDAGDGEPHDAAAGGGDAQQPTVIAG